MFYRTVAVILIAASMACSRGNERRVAATPTSPTTASAEGSIVYVGGVSGPMDVLFPGRNESFQFRLDLETKYQTGLNRAAAATAVDREGEVVWTQEYIRYRVNGCDHGTALQRVMTQIDGGAAGGICSAPPEGIVLFPSRADSLEFRRALETKYQQMGRVNSSSVDLEGAVIWIQEYLRYRANGCDHATAEAKVFAQIDGGPVQDVCRVACTLSASPSGNIFAFTGGTGSFEVRPNQANCNINWTASSDASWLTFDPTLSPGTGFTVLPYSVSQNNAPTTRFGNITITWSTGNATYRVEQGGSIFNSGFTLTDPFRSGNQETTECHLRSTATPCNLASFANLPGNTYTYAWSVSYFYGTQKNFVGTGSTISFTDTCGGSGSAADGPAVDLDVTLTIQDERGNSITLRTGQGNQPSLRVRLFTC